MGLDQREKPLRDAADEVRALAADARFMLAQLESGWLWALLTIPSDPRPDESKDP